MNEELINTLIAALELSPTNAVLRRQVVQCLIDSHKWSNIDAFARPLLETDDKGWAMLAMSLAAYNTSDIETARHLYENAIRIDPGLMDEQYEATLAPRERLRLPVDEYNENDEFVEPRSRFLPYSGPKVTFKDIGGMGALKEQIRMNILYPFEHPDLYATYGKKIGGGILLYGPPGCGKTYISRATAGELGANFYILELNEVLNMWVGGTEKGLHELFETARANSPSIIFIDEIDAIGAKRSQVNSSSIRSSISQLLTEMDGIASSNDNLLVLGATNAPWDVDAAFRRPGRFDRVMFVPPPDESAREEIFKLHSRDRKIDPNIPWRQIASKTECYSGADIASLVDRACEYALSEAIRFGKARDVSAGDFNSALKSSNASATEWLRRAKNYVKYANQDGLYNDLAAYLAGCRI